MADKQSQEMEEIRSGLEDVVSVATKLKPICTTVEELIEVCELAVKSDAQLKLLYQAITSKK